MGGFERREATVAIRVAPDEWEIRVFFMQKPVTFEEKYTVRRIPGRVLRSILDAAEEHRVELFRQWEESRAGE